MPRSPLTAPYDVSVWRASKQIPTKFALHAKTFDEACTILVAEGSVALLDFVETREGAEGAIRIKSGWQSIPKAAIPEARKATAGERIHLVGKYRYGRQSARARA